MERERRGRRRTRSIAAAAALVLAAALPFNPAVPAAAAPAPTATSVARKPLLRGVVYSRPIVNQDYEPSGNGVPAPADGANGVDGFVVNVGWDQLQPDQSLGASQPIASGNVLDTAIATARARRLQIKLRVFTGYRVPRWVKELDFDCTGLATSECGIHLVEQPVDNAFAHDEHVAKFWSAAYGQAYADLQSKLAARYDDVPELRQVTISRCMTFYPETFLRQSAYAPNPPEYAAAGYTVEADERCHQEQIAAHVVWKRTRSELALNPFNGGGAGTGGAGLAFTTTMMTACRTALAVRCVLSNGSIRWPPLAGPYTTMYEKMVDLGPPLSFQTATKARIGDGGAGRECPVEPSGDSCWRETLDWAVTQGANSVELLDDLQGYPAGELATFDRRLAANPLR